MLYVKVDSNGNPQEMPITEAQLRAEFKSVCSLPAQISLDDIIPLGYDELPEESVMPERKKFFTLTPDIPVRGEDGKLRRAYTYIPYWDGELEARWKAIRKKRDELLAQTDITQITDFPIPENERQEWQLYRQALRDITTQSEDPQMLVWPTAPSDL